MLRDTSYASELRNLIAKCVSGDPQTYNPVFLGHNNSDYCNCLFVSFNSKVPKCYLTFSGCSCEVPLSYKNFNV